MRDYDDVLSRPRPRRRIREVPAEVGLVVETADSRYCGAIVAVGQALDAGEKRDTVTLEDRHHRRREFAMHPAAFMLDGELVTLVPKRPQAPAKPPRRRTASGSLALGSAEARTARVARASRIWVEGIHDAALVERIWGDDLRAEGVVVEPLDGIDNLRGHVTTFGPGPGRRIGVLVDHLLAGTKEARIAAQVRDPNVLVTGHPYVDVWQAVKPVALGIPSWPEVPRGIAWKDGVCAALGAGDPRDLWRRVLASVHSFADVEVPLLRAVEELIDFVTA